MTAVEEQQMLASLVEISQDLKALLAFNKDQAREQEKPLKKRCNIWAISRTSGNGCENAGG